MWGLCTEMVPLAPLYWTLFYSIWFLVAKDYFDIFDNLYFGKRFVLCVSPSHEFQFLSCVLPPNLSCLCNSFTIKHRNIGVFLFYPSFFSKSYTSLELLILSFSNLLIYNLNSFVFSPFLYLPSSIPFSSPTRTPSLLGFSRCLHLIHGVFWILIFVVAPFWWLGVQCVGTPHLC